MLSFSKIKNVDLNKILQIRAHGSGFEKNAERAEFSFPHETYTLGLSSLKDSSLPRPERAGTRVVEISNESFRSIYELYLDKGVQMFSDKGFISEYEAAFESIAIADKEVTNYNIRTLRIPALYIDALWLHDAIDVGNDKFILVRPFQDLEKNQFYTWNYFFSKIKDAAQKIDLQDGMLGA